MKHSGVAWRTMTGYDLEAVERIAGEVHPDFYESLEVLAERHRLYQHGSYILEVNERPAGYLLSHPFTLGTLPVLNALLGELPPEPDTYYIHDLALLPVARRVGAASFIVNALTKHARAHGYPSMSLVAVNGSAGFWERHGFAVVEVPELTQKLQSYEDAARYMVRQS